MSKPATSNKSAAIAAFVILGVTGTVCYYMPAMMLATSAISPWLAVGLAAALVLCFFGVFWARGKRRNRGEADPE